jgi:DNA-binding transcriptional LysR family regulator
MKAYPGVKVHIEYSRTDKVCDACLNNTMDIGIVAFPVRRAHLAVVEFGSGLSILPETTVVNKVKSGLLVTLDFAEGRFTRSVGIIDRRRARLPAAAREFVRLLMTTR